MPFEPTPLSTMDRKAKVDVKLYDVTDESFRQAGAADDKNWKKVGDVVNALTSGGTTRVLPGQYAVNNGMVSVISPEGRVLTGIVTPETVTKLNAAGFTNNPDIYVVGSTGEKFFNKTLTGQLVTDRITANAKRAPTGTGWAR